MGGADVKRTESVADRQAGLADWQKEQAETYLGYAGEDRARRDAALEPLMFLAQDLSSGSSEAMTRGAAPALSQLARGYGQARGQLALNPARGAASDFARRQLDVQQADATAQALGQAWTKGLDLTQSIGSQYGNFALQEAGAGSRFGEGSGTTRAQQGQTEAAVMQAENAKKQARMGLIGDLVGAFAGPLMGGIGGLFGGGGGGSNLSSMPMAAPAGHPAYNMQYIPQPQPAWTPQPVAAPVSGGTPLTTGLIGAF
jgi:hypothetical protein